MKDNQKLKNKKKESAYNAGATGRCGLIPGLERSPGEEHGNPLQCSCLENLHEQRSLAGCMQFMGLQTVKTQLSN